MTAGQGRRRVRRGGRPGRGAAGRHRRGAGAAAVPADPDDRLRAEPVHRCPGQGPVRARGPAPGGAGRPAAVPRRRARPERSGGDLAVQACSDDPQVAVHAIRNLARIGFGTTSVRYSQLGFGRTSSTSRAQATPRNLMGFKDGTRNLKLEDTAKLRAAAVGAAWRRAGLDGRRLVPGHPADPDDDRDLGPHLAGRAGGDHRPGQGHRGAAGQGRRVRRARLRDQGQRRASLGSPRRRTSGSRTRRSTTAPELLRRGYNFVDGSDGLGRLDAGLFFLAYQRDPRKQFIPVQRKLARRRAERVHQARRLRRLRLPGRCPAWRVLGREALRLTGRSSVCRMDPRTRRRVTTGVLLLLVAIVVVAALLR